MVHAGESSACLVVIVLALASSGGGQEHGEPAAMVSRIKAKP
jgi:hypothetical protein